MSYVLIGFALFWPPFVSPLCAQIRITEGLPNNDGNDDDKKKKHHLPVVPEPDTIWAGIGLSGVILLDIARRKRKNWPK